MIGPCSGLFGLYGFENGKRCRHVNFYCQKILKGQKNYENLDFSTCGLCLAFKNLFGLFSMFLAFRYLQYSKSFKFELFWSNFAIKTILLKIWQSGSVQCEYLGQNNFSNKISNPSSQSFRKKLIKYVFGSLWSNYLLIWCVIQWAGHQPVFFGW